MALSLTIAGVDRTRQVRANSLRIDNILTNKRDTCAFDVVSSSGDAYAPSLAQEVIVYDGATKIFGGVITGVNSQPTAYGVVTHEVRCQDYTRLLDSKLVPDSFTDKTVEEIIDTLAASYFPAGFTTANVVAPVNLSYVSFNYKPLSKCLEELANLLNYDWYVDYDKDVHFFAKETVAAPFALADGDGSYVYDSLILRRDNSQIRNSIVVRGGEYLGSQLTTDLQTDGVRAMYNLPYRFADFAAHLTGHVLSLGVDPLDSPDGYDALYNFQEKLLKFKEADKPSASKTLKVSGKPYLPVIVKVRSSANIAAMASAEGGDGVYEHLVVDRSIGSKEGARQRACAEIEAYATTLSEGEFVTYTAGLRAGQAIDVVSASRGVDETYVINRVTVRQHGANSLEYRVSLITTRSMDLVDVLQRLILASTKELVIDPNETVDIVFDLADTVATADSVAATSTSDAGYVWGTPDWGFSTWA